MYSFLCFLIFLLLTTPVVLQAATASGKTNPPSIYDGAYQLWGMTTDDSGSKMNLPAAHIGMVSLPHIGSLAPMLALSTYLKREGHRVSVFTTDEAIPFFPEGALRRQATSNCQAKKYYWDGDKNVFLSFSIFGTEDGLAKIEADGTVEINEEKRTENKRLAGEFFCQCFMARYVCLLASLSPAPHRIVPHPPNPTSHTLSFLFAVLGAIVPGNWCQVVQRQSTLVTCLSTLV